MHWVHDGEVRLHDSYRWPRDAAEVLVLARALATSYVVDETAFRAAFDANGAIGGWKS